MRFYHITETYINYLRQFDQMVYKNKNESRPYVGVVLSVGGIQYFAPFTSPKSKHLRMKNSLDFRKINGGKFGAINLNNMIPVVESALLPIDIPSIKDYDYRRLLQNQYLSIEKDEKNIINNAFKLRRVILTDDSLLSEQMKVVKARCCNLKLLEEKYLLYK